MRIAAAYCIMRLSTDVSWKLFAELFLNTTPRDIPGMRASAQAVAKLLMNNFPVSGRHFMRSCCVPLTVLGKNIASELYKLYDTPLGQKDEAGPGNKGSKPKASKKKKKKKRQAATSANSPTVPQPDNAIPLSPSTEDGDLPALDSDSDSDPEFSAVVDSIGEDDFFDLILYYIRTLLFVARARGDDESCFSSSDEE